MGRSLTVKLGLVVAALLVVELFLRVAGAWIPRIDEVSQPSWHEKRSARFLLDPRKGPSGNPSHVEHDEWGFRNPVRPETAEVVAIGDSFTYGHGVGRTDAWPARLAKKLSRGVYNMGMNGTAPVHYLHNLSVAIDLRPRVILVAIWLGNDVAVDGDAMVMDSQAIARVSKDLLARARLKEAESPWKATASYYYNCGEVKPESPHADESRNLRGLVGGSKIYGLLRSLKSLLVTDLAAPDNGGDLVSAPIAVQFRNDLRAIDSSQFKFCYPLDTPDLETILVQGWRSRAMDDSDVRVALGIELLKSSVVLMKETTERLGVDLLIVLLPTKESVYSPMLEDVDEPEARQLVELVREREARISSQVKEHLTRNEIAYVDLLSVLREAEVQPFFGSRDAHLNGHGHEVVAGALASRLRHLRWDASAD